MSERLCPYCGGDAGGDRCAKCGRDATGPRRICAHCKKMTPSKERLCAHCRGVAPNDLGWKIPLIIGMFVAAFILSLILAGV